MASAGQETGREVATGPSGTDGRLRLIRETSVACSKAQGGVERGPVGTVDILFLGTGVSIGVPNVMHALKGDCHVCVDAHTRPDSKDRRNNVSIAVLLNTPGLGERPCVMVDCGKTMRDAILRRFPGEGLRTVQSIVLTHGHADAIFGLDDVRDLQLREPLGSGFRVLSGAIRVFLHQQTMEVLQQGMPYLTCQVPFLDRENLVMQRNVALLDFQVIEPDSHFEACGVPFRAFRVFHGGEYVSLGFSIGAPGAFVYISDVKVIPPSSLAYLKSLPRIRTLVLDCLHPSDAQHYAHTNMPEALEIVKELDPERVLFTGMCCEMGPHDARNRELAQRGFPHVSLAYDGLVVRGVPIKAPA